MPKTIVNIIAEDNPNPDYLFIKEMYEEGDYLMYISAKDTEDDLDALSELFNVPTTHIEEIVLQRGSDYIFSLSSKEHQIRHWNSYQGQYMRARIYLL